MEDNNKNIMIENIKEWMKLDSDLSKLSKEIRDKRKHKKNITDNLINIMKQNKVECFNINGGALLYKNITSKKPINKKILLNTLKEYYKDDKVDIEDIVNYIMENRETQQKETITRKIEK